MSTAPSTAAVGVSVRITLPRRDDQRVGRRLVLGLSGGHTTVTLLAGVAMPED